MAYLDQVAIKTNVSPELLSRGWELYDYREPAGNPHGDDLIGCYDCYWSGVATHKDAPGYILGVWVSQRDSMELSGKTVDAMRGYQFEGDQLLTFNLPVFPTFQATPKGFGWHIEKQGQIIHKGKFANDVRHSGIDRINGAAVRQWVDKVEQIALKKITYEPRPIFATPQKARRLIQLWAGVACNLEKVTHRGEGLYTAYLQLKSHWTAQHVVNRLMLNPQVEMQPRDFYIKNNNQLIVWLKINV